MVRAGLAASHRQHRIKLPRQVGSTSIPPRRWIHRATTAHSDVDARRKRQHIDHDQHVDGPCELSHPREPPLEPPIEALLGVRPDRHVLRAPTRSIPTLSDLHWTTQLP